MTDTVVRIDADKLETLREKIKNNRTWGFLFNKEAVEIAINFYLKKSKPEK